MNGLFESIVVLNLCLMAGILSAILVGIWRLVPLIAALSRTLATTQEAVERASALLKDAHEKVVPVLESTRGALDSVDQTLHEEVRPLLSQAGRSVDEVQSLLLALNGKVQPVARVMDKARRLPQSVSGFAAVGGRTIKRTLSRVRSRQTSVPEGEAPPSVTSSETEALTLNNPASRSLIARLVRRNGNP